MRLQWAQKFIITIYTIEEEKAMGEQLIKPYQISIWEDKLIETDEESYYEEVKIATIGSDTMTSQARVYSPVFKINTK